MPDFPLGHNNPPMSLEEALEPANLQQALLDQNRRHVTRSDDLLAAVTRFHEEFVGGIKTDTDQGRATDFVRQIKMAAKDSEAARESAGGPLLRATRTVNAFFKAGIVDKLNEAAAGIEAVMTTYARAKAEENRRIAIQKQAEANAHAERLMKLAETLVHAEIIEQAIVATDAAMAADRVAQGSLADMSRTRGDLGGVASLRSRWTFRVTNINDVPPEYLTINQVALNAAIRAGARDVPGVEIYDDARTVVR